MCEKHASYEQKYSIQHSIVTLRTKRTHDVSSGEVNQWVYEIMIE